MELAAPMWAMAVRPMLACAPSNSALELTKRKVSTIIAPFHDVA